jgi:hypothetical protein
MNNVPDDAPDLLHKNPETTPDIIANKFVGLYRRARRHFCQEALKSTTTDSAWDAALRPEWSPADHNPVEFDERLSKRISRSWDEVRPPVQQTAPYIEADPSLLDVHSGLAHTFDVREGQIMPERIALFNLRLWMSRSLHWLWDHRLTGELVALFGVQTGSVQLEGLSPKPMLDACLNGSHDFPNKSTDTHANRQRHPAPSDR